MKQKIDTLLVVGAVREPPLAVLGPLVLAGGVYRLPSLLRFPELVHGISGRYAPTGGDWNLSARRGTTEHPPSQETALAHRALFAQTLSLSPASVVGCQQVHGAEVAVVGPEDGGRGMEANLPSVQGADALVTATPGLALMSLSADCPSVFVYDMRRHVVGLAHSGWKGTVGRIAANVVDKMREEFGTDPVDVVAAVGPGIGPCCYAVGPNVVDAAEASFGRAAWEQSARHGPLLAEHDGSVYFDIPEAVRLSLLDAGVPHEAITLAKVCTGHNTNVFYSHRIEKGECGLFGAIFGMRATLSGD